MSTSVGNPNDKYWHGTRPYVVENKKYFDSNLLVIVYSSRLGGKFECHKFREYNIDIDMETDADTFDFVFKNHCGGYNSLFSKNDVVDIYINDIGILSGRVDRVEYHFDSGDSYIRVSGRDLAAALVDNDAIPRDLQNVKPQDYIRSKCAEYGIQNSDIAYIDPLGKFSIGVGSSEIAVMTDMIEGSNMKMWLDYHTFHVGRWNNGAQPSYTFTSHVPIDKMMIPILSLDITEDGTEQYSESIVYGTTDDGDNKIVGTYKNNHMINTNIKKRTTVSAPNNSNTDKYIARAEDDVRYGFDNSHEVSVSIVTKKDFLIQTNRVALLIDGETNTCATFFIKAVNYSKSLSDGSITKVTMIPSRQANDAMYARQGTIGGGLTGRARMTYDELIASRKG